eukprot:3258005-Amphidinium_carterae.1
MLPAFFSLPRSVAPSQGSCGQHQPHHMDSASPTLRFYSSSHGTQTPNLSGREKPSTWYLVLRLSMTALPVVLLKWSFAPMSYIATAAN